MASHVESLGYAADDTAEVLELAVIPAGTFGFDGAPMTPQVIAHGIVESVEDSAGASRLQPALIP